MRLLLITLSAVSAVFAQDALPKIELRDVPLSGALSSLASQAELNIFVDPQVSGAGKAPEPKVSVQWTNLTAAHGLQKLLTENRLAAITNRATSVMRIVPASIAATEFPTNNLGDDTGRAMPRIGMEFMPLVEALTKLSEAAQVTLKMDSSVRTALEKQDPVSFAWRNVTPKQALAALADNFGISLTKVAGEAAFRVQTHPVK